MLPIYQAISFNRVITKGGRTEPWVILVNAENSIKPYVVKIFKTDCINIRDSVANEVLGNILAKEFNLPVPNAALIDLSDDFINTIKDQNLLEILEDNDLRLKFGSELKDGFFNFDYTAYNLNDVRKIIDIDNVFAFDNLIRNRDRNGRLKPNILIKSNEAYLIDHELGFEELSLDIIDGIKQYKLDRGFCAYHIFYTFLKQSPIRIKKEYFNEFEEYLRRLDVNILNPYFRQLSDVGFSTKNHSLITAYLTGMKQNSVRFAENLKLVIQ